jgi:hypothetical protein
MTRAPYPAALACLALLAACSADDVTSLKGSSEPVPAAATWAVGVSGCVKASDCTTLRNALVFSLTSAKLLQHAVPAGAPAVQSLEVAVVHLHMVAPAERTRYGLVAGRNEVAAVVTVKSAAGAVLRSFKVSVKGGDYPYQDTIQDTFRQFDADVVAALKA